jgi:hypothetical protein
MVSMYARAGPAEYTDLLEMRLMSRGARANANSVTNAV